MQGHSPGGNLPTSSKGESPMRFPQPRSETPAGPGQDLPMARVQGEMRGSGAVVKSELHDDHESVGGNIHSPGRPQSVPSGKPKRGTLQSNPKFWCSFCGKPFLTKGGWTVHENQHKGIFRHHCEVCQKGFPSLGRLKTHLAHEHDLAEPGAGGQASPSKPPEGGAEGSDKTEKPAE